MNRTPEPAATMDKIKVQIAFSELTSSELEFIIQSIKPNAFRELFQKNPGQFSKIRPGFRPHKISHKDSIEIACKNIERQFISNFVKYQIESQMEALRQDCKAMINQVCLSIRNCIKRAPKSTVPGQHRFGFEPCFCNL